MIKKIIGRGKQEQEDKRVEEKSNDPSTVTIPRKYASHKGGEFRW